MVANPRVRVALYEKQGTIFLFCDADNFVPDDDKKMALERSAQEVIADFVESILIVFQAAAPREFAYIVSTNREVSREEAEGLLPTLLGGMDIDNAGWLTSKYALKPRQGRVVKRHESGTLKNNPTA